MHNKQRPEEVISEQKAELERLDRVRARLETQVQGWREHSRNRDNYARSVESFDERRLRLVDALNELKNRYDQNKNFGKIAAFYIDRYLAADSNLQKALEEFVRTRTGQVDTIPEPVITAPIMKTIRELEKKYEAITQEIREANLQYADVQRSVEDKREILDGVRKRFSTCMHELLKDYQTAQQHISELGEKTERHKVEVDNRAKLLEKAVNELEEWCRQNSGSDEAFQRISSLINILNAINSSKSTEMALNSRVMTLFQFARKHSIRTPPRPMHIQTSGLSPLYTPRLDHSASTKRTNPPTTDIPSSPSSVQLNDKIARMMREIQKNASQRVVIKDPSATAPI